MKSKKAYAGNTSELELVNAFPREYDALKAVWYNNIGKTYQNMGNYDRALECYNRGLSLFKEAHNENHEWMTSFYNNIALIYHVKKKYRLALKFYE